MEIRIWYKPNRGKAEVIDRAENRKDASYLVFEYRMAYGLLTTQKYHGTAKVWAGRKIDEPTAY